MSRVQGALVLLLLWVSPAAAQQVGSDGVPYRTWDIHGAFGFHSSNRDGGDGWQDSSWEPSWSASFDVGRYWTSHLKTEVGVAHLGRANYYRQRPIVGPTGRDIGQIFSSADVGQTQVVVAGSYQFLENTFAHPYVSAGARIGLLDLRIVTTNYLFPSAGAPVPPIPGPPVEEREHEVRVRPFVAVGSKSYFSERVFMRPEMLVAFNDAGASQFGLRLGIGFDF